MNRFNPFTKCLERYAVFWTQLPSFLLWEYCCWFKSVAVQSCMSSVFWMRLSSFLLWDYCGWFKSAAVQLARLLRPFGSSADETQNSILQMSGFLRCVFRRSALSSFRDPGLIGIIFRKDNVVTLFWISQTSLQVKCSPFLLYFCILCYVHVRMLFLWF